MIGSDTVSQMPVTVSERAAALLQQVIEGLELVRSNLHEVHQLLVGSSEQFQ